MIHALQETLQDLRATLQEVQSACRSIVEENRQRHEERERNAANLREAIRRCERETSLGAEVERLKKELAFWSPGGR